MKNLFHAIALTTIAGLSVIPGLALADEMDPAKMTCADFSKMDSAGMMAAVDAMHKASPDGAMAMDDAGMKAAVDTTMKGCEGHDDMMAMDAMMMK